MEEMFKPHPNMVLLYRIYFALVAVPIAVCGVITSWLVYLFEPTYLYVSVLAFFAPIIAALCFILYWSSRYYSSINFRLTGDEVVVERGVWWRFKSTVPYARIMSVDIVQGPISRRLGIATVDGHTAGYTGVAGGTAGPGSRRAEASLIHIPNYAEVREKVLSAVRGRPLFTSTVSGDMLVELRRIRELLERQRTPIL